MKIKNRLIVLAVAMAINAAALAALHVAMVEGTERALAGNAEREHVVVSAAPTPAEVARSNCPATKAL
jgi:hypothetical protein